MDWIIKNTPSDAVFLVEGQSFKGTSIIGGDAGWYLPVLTKRRNTMPPQYALAFEKSIDPNYNQDMIDLVFQLEETQLSDSSVIPLICKNGITHVYIGQRQTYVSPQAKQSFFSKTEVMQNPAFELIYQQDRVSIFALKPEACVK
jgi:hypothetical protein